jgi:AcrR family transcriptional regulator
MQHPQRPHPPSTRRQREITARRGEILSAARSVFAERGYASATLDEIAARAELAKGTIYNYFKNKEDIFREVVESVLTDFEEMAKDAVGDRGSAREIYYRYAERTFEYFSVHGDVLRLVAREMMRLQVEGSPDNLRQFQQNGRLVAEILSRPLKRELRGKNAVGAPLEDLAQIFTAMVHHRSLNRLFQEQRHREPDSHEDALLVTSLFFDGVRAQ